MIYPRCDHCGGYVAETDPEDGPKCWACGRSPEPPPTEAQLRAAGIGELVRKQETQGLRRKGTEYTPAILRLKRPLR